MKPFRLVSFFLLAWWHGHACAQGSAGGRAAAMGGASVALHDLWSAFHNQAGLAWMEHTTAGIYNHTPFLLDELSTRGAAVAVVTKTGGVFAAGMHYFGYALYNERKAGLAYARKFGDKVSAGVQMDYLGTTISEGYGTGAAYTFELGLLAEVMPKVFLAAHAFNPIRAKRSALSDEKIPAILKAGLAYVPSDKVVLTVESEKDLDRRAVFKSGLEYHPVKALFLRTGISTNPVRTAFGAGLEIESFRLDVAAAWQDPLGYSHHVSLAYRFN